jgi:4-hydroxy-tetrahydrodipicolinate synthase
MVFESSLCHPAWSGTIHGVVPIIPTPFHDDELIDFESLERLIDFAASTGVTAVCLPAYGSEFYKLSERERADVVRAAVNFARGRVKVVAQSNHSSENTSQVVENAYLLLEFSSPGMSAAAHTVFSSRLAAETAQQNQDAGAEVISFALPRMFSLSEDDLLRYATRVARSVTVPVLVQDFNPGGASVGASFARQLHEKAPNFLFLKLEEPLMAPKVRAIREATAGAVGVFEGWGGMYLLELLPAGICGTMPGLSIVDLFQSAVRYAREGDTVAASRLFERMLPFIVYSLQNLELFHHCEKGLLAKRGLLQKVTVRDATVSPDESTRQYLEFLFSGILEAVASNRERARALK